MTTFSVFLPVRNGWPYVQECVESVLRQTYPHFELVVLDNHSSDETVPWLRSLQSERIRVLTSSAPLSIEQSWQRIKSAPKREFMTMIGHDDVLDSRFLEVTRALIERHPRASLYQTGGRLIDFAGQRIRSCGPVPESETAAQYLEARLELRREAFGTGFVMRAADYERVGGIPPFERLFFADDALWLSLMRGAYKAADPTEGFGVRIHPNSESASTPSLWQPMLVSLGQYSRFLRELALLDSDSREVLARLEEPFMLNRHRTVYLYALLDACQKGAVLEEDVVRRIEDSLARHAPGQRGRLARSPAVMLLRLANALPLRRLVMIPWRLYYALRTRAAA